MSSMNNKQSYGLNNSIRTCPQYNSINIPTMRFSFSSECEFVVPPPPPATDPPNPKEVQSDIVGVDPPSWEEPNHYMFNFFHYLDVCPQLSVCYCPRHHTIPSQYVIPNMVSGNTPHNTLSAVARGLLAHRLLHSFQPMGC